MDKFELKLTETHLKKCTLNGARLADLIGAPLGFSFDQLANGDRETFAAWLEPHTSTALTFYKPKSKPERRFSIKGLSSRARAGQTLRIWFDPERISRQIRIEIE